MATREVAKQTSGYTGEVEMSPATRATVEAMIMDVLDDQELDSNSMFDDILAATTWQGVDVGGKIDAFADVAASPVVVTSIKARPSTKANGLRVFLVVTGYHPDGVMYEAATSSAEVVIKLLQLHTLGQLPIIVSVYRAEKPTRNGNFPQHLKIHGKPAE